MLFIVDVFTGIAKPREIIPFWLHKDSFIAFATKFVPIRSINGNEDGKIFEGNK